MKRLKEGRDGQYSLKNNPVINDSMGHRGYYFWSHLSRAYSLRAVKFNFTITDHEFISPKPEATTTLVNNHGGQKTNTPTKQQQ
jgi:hypothetical protein